MAARRNILFIIIDQFRGDCVRGALADHVALPNLRALAADAVLFDTHYSVAAPCGPSRASLLTGQYVMNHGSLRNGTPLRRDTPTLGTEARRAGYDPLLFGYTDVTVDPRGLDPSDPRLTTYEEVAEGFHEALRMRLEDDEGPWRAHLVAKGYAPARYPDTYIPDGDTLDAPAIYSAEDSDTAFLTDEALRALRAADPGWFGLVTYLRPHPPFVAPAPYNKMYAPDAMPDPLPVPGDLDPYCRALRQTKTIATVVEGFPHLPDTPEVARQLRALYFGLASEVDAHIGRLTDWLKDSGQYDDTIIVVTSDHGEMLGDFGLWGKHTFHDAAFHTTLIIRDPSHPGSHGLVVETPTESVDVAPTLLELIGVPTPDSMNGRSLAPFLQGETPEDWRLHTFSELHYGDPVMPTVQQRALGLRANEASLAVFRKGDFRLVHFAGGLPQRLHRAFSEGQDLSADPANMQILLDLSREMLCHRMQTPEGTFARTMVTPQGLKRGDA
ncbi:MAG: sulfatase-like hydrolase/transferase [Paracoccaceae bacterium]|nr:sulfatase-like hydrolase/transferase [Paracoccaceae bacterium]